LNGSFTEVVWAPFLDWVDTNADTFHYYGTGDEPVEMTTMGNAANFTAQVAVDPNANGVLNCNYSPKARCETEEDCVTCNVLMQTPVLADRKFVKEMVRLQQEVYHAEPRIQRMGSREHLYHTKIPILKAQP
jgi:hypothetical protein